MKVEVDIEISNSATRCKYDQKCKENFDSSLCCDIVSEGPGYLLVSPVSTFKSSNCSYIRMIRGDENKIPVCSCPVRIAIYKKYKV